MKMRINFKLITIQQNSQVVTISTQVKIILKGVLVHDQKETHDK